MADENRWPEVTIWANGRVEDPSGFRKLNFPQPPEERYVPVSSPNVLSEEEARLLAKYATTHNIASDRVLDRLRDFADGSTNG